jgi:tRNA-specific 2-thiouridylase
VDTAGRVLGRHRGIIHYTVGQRDGLGIAVGRKVYVKEIRAASNTLVVDDREGVLADACRVADMQWIAGGARCVAPGHRPAALPPQRRRLPLHALPRRARPAVRRAAVRRDAGPDGGALRRRRGAGRRLDHARSCHTA